MDKSIKRVFQESVKNSRNSFLRFPFFNRFDLVRHVFVFIVTASDTSDLYASYFQKNQQEEAVAEIHSALCGFFVLNSLS